MELILNIQNNLLNIEEILSQLPDCGKEYDFLLLQCYCHIKNEEIYFEIDKDIFLHDIIYEGTAFYDAVKQYSFELQRGCILAYKNKDYPILKMDDFADSFDDFETFEKQMRILFQDRTHKPAFLILFDSKKAEIVS